jgi:5-methylcytosine-specific restriction endonuclease McrA
MAVWIDSVIQRRRLSAIWIRLVEPLLRFWPTYPPDWQLRRMLVFERAHGCCEQCGWSVGNLRQLDDGWRMVGAHVHHLKPISRGGRHGLANLRLLCAVCHARQHPGNERLQTYARARR